MPCTNQSTELNYRIIEQRVTSVGSPCIIIKKFILTVLKKLGNIMQTLVLVLARDFHNLCNSTNFYNITLSDLVICKIVIFREMYFYEI